MSKLDGKVHTQRVTKTYIKCDNVTLTLSDDKVRFTSELSNHPHDDWIVGKGELQPLYKILKEVFGG